ncbi:MAG: mechanosensitive ion channel family protein [Burkholderiaceae bacterium]
MNPAQNLWSQLLADLNDPNLQWQLLAVLGCIVAAWWLSRVLVRRLSASGGAAGVNQVSLRRLLTPLLVLLFIVLATRVLSSYQSVGLLRVAIPLALSYLLIRAVFYLLRMAFAPDGRVGVILQTVEQALAVLIWAGVALYITGLWPEFVDYLEQTKLPVGRHHESLKVLLQALIWVGVTLVLALWAAALLEQRLMQLDSMHSSLRAVLARVGRGLLILVAVLISLSLVGIDLTVLSVFGGALGVGLGLGLQKLVSSYVSGFVVLLERSLSIGDLVSVEKFSGQIVQINTRYTVLRASDGTEAIIPNEMLVSQPVQNFSLSDRNARVSSVFKVAHGADVERLLAAIPVALAKLPQVLATPAPSAHLLSMSIEGLEIEAAVWIDDPYKLRGSVQSAMNRTLLTLLNEQQVGLSSILPTVTSGNP